MLLIYGVFISVFIIFWISFREIQKLDSPKRKKLIGS
jgi:hypothetical protein